ncbi:hypothetical protein ACQZV8_17470 [Magnetococcales bacterium HHB-1]
MVVLLALGEYYLASPSNLDWLKSGDITRGVMAFTGTAHHADSAMDILLPFGLAVIMLALRFFSLPHILLVAIIFVLSFLWHPREFFQIGIFLGICGGMIFFEPKEKRKRKWLEWIGLLLLAAMIAVSIVVWYFAILSPEAYTHHADEGSLKINILAQALNPAHIFGFRFPFFFPMHVSTNTTTLNAAWQLFPWLMLTASGAIALVFYGNRQDKQITQVFLATWILLFSWNFSILATMALTYSEMMTTTPRIIYIYAYILLAAGLFVFCKRISNALYPSGPIVATAVTLLFLLAGFVFHQLISQAIPIESFVLAMTLSILIVLATVLLAVHPTSVCETVRPPSPLIATLMLSFLLPILIPNYLNVLPRLATYTRPAMEWYNQRSVLGLSQELIHFMQSTPPKDLVMVHPLGDAVTSIYSAQWRLSTVPMNVIDTIRRDSPIKILTRKDEHPLFPERSSYGPHFTLDRFDHHKILCFTKNAGASTILIEKSDYRWIKPYIVSHPESYAIVFDHSDKGELVAQRVGSSPESCTGNEIDVL